MELISVIIPVYNRDKELRRALQSVLAQSHSNFEVLIVDDCSEIDIESVVNSFNDLRFRYFKLQQKGNANVCRNVGLRESKGDYIAMLDSDDEWLPYHLQKSLNALFLLQADGIYGAYIVDDGENKSKSIVRPLRENETMVNYIMDGNSAATPTHFYRAAPAKNTLWNETLHRHQDYDYAIRFSEKYSFLPTYLFTVVVHWKKNERRKEHFDSNIRFIQTYKSSIQPGLYLKYHREMLSSLLNRRDVPKEVVNYFRAEVTKFIAHMSLVDYLSTFGSNKGKIMRFILRFVFIFKVLTS